MDSRYDIYGFVATTLEEALAHVQQVLSLQLDTRDSSYYGGTYYLYKPSYGRELRLYRNHDARQGTWVRERYRDHAVILEVSNLDHMDEIRRQVMNGQPRVVLLSSRTLPADSADEDVGKATE